MLHALFICVVSSLCLAAPTLKIQGSTTVNPVVVEAAQHFRAKGWKIFVDTQGGSSGGIAALGDKLVTIAMSSRPINDKDRAKHPKVDFRVTVIGYDGVALAVSRKVYDGGVHALTKAQLRDIYEARIQNWKDVGGPASPIVFFNKEPGRGTWEVFAHFLYDSPDKAPSVHHPEVGGNEEGRTKVASHASAITQLSAAWVESSEKIKSIAIKTDNGKEILPTNENIYNHMYPMRRDLLVVTNGNPQGSEADFIRYILSDEGQELVKKHGYLRLKSMP